MLNLLPALFRARRWLRDTLVEHAPDAKPLGEFGFKRLPRYFPENLLARTKVALVEQIPRAPIEQWGVGKADQFQSLEATGMALNDMVFIKPGAAARESVFFHELVHVLQWERLGINRFLLLYGLYLMKHDYYESPLEVMASQLESRFTNEDQVFEAAPIVQRRTDELLARLREQAPLNRVVLGLLRLF